MKLWKKIIIATSFVVLTTGGLAGCSSSEKKQENKTETSLDIASMLRMQVENREKTICSMTNAGTLSNEDKRKHRAIIQFLTEQEKVLHLEKNISLETAFDHIKTAFNAQTAQLKAENDKIQQRLHNLFVFSEAAFMDGNEVLVLVTELTVNAYSARFIALYGSEDYHRHNENLMLRERQDDIMKEIDALGL